MNSRPTASLCGFKTSLQGTSLFVALCAAAIASAPPEIVVMTDDIASTRSSTFARAKGLRGGRVARDGRRREKRAIARSHGDNRKIFRLIEAFQGS